ncbi:ABC-type oligopeptide transport system, periplasmic component [Rubellimicrobium thermophilum DSM 16684]|uniref:ABC-type oligopeptide transport system, periplasmic component n=1 Tax=Rubellimicrobium thermophilum DSM 16684 TaxID=1123069 RepID=S9S412_9RHOB|nr:extracellular solute-binding protein [Rubellimicrobium thermophilum]EPX84930.1 ABC-type oligopeptide transport system, periplasmic component [Rubellimicrobium thermophilum DSM 16684]
MPAACPAAFRPAVRPAASRSAVRLRLAAAVLPLLAAWPAAGQETAPEPAPTAETAGAAAAGVTIAHGYTFFGNLRYPADFPHLDYVNPDAPKGGEIAIWAQGTFDSFNNFTIQGNAAALASIGQETILTGVADDPTDLYCYLCTTLEYPADLSWVVFNLRPEARFSDGTPLTAEDVAFSHQLFMEQGLESFRFAFGSFIESVTVEGPHRVRFDFTPDSPPRDRIGLAGGIPVLSKAWFEQTGRRLDQTWPDGPALGSGAYVLESFDVNRRITWVRDPDWWGADLPINRGRANFDRIRVEYFADAGVALEAFKAGEYTFRNENSSLQWATGYDFPAVQQGHVIKTELPDGNLASAQSFVFNLRREKFQDPRVREAIGLMFNFEWSNATLFYGLYTRVQSFWGNSDLMAEGPPSEGERALLQPLVDEGLLDPAILTAEAVLPPVSNPAREIDRANLRRASQLLDEAGWTIGPDGLRRNAAGEVLTVSFLESSPSFERIILPYVENLKRLGIDARLDMVDPAQEEQRRATSDFDIATQSFAMDWEPGTGLRQWFGSEGAAESNRNLMGLQDPAVDRLIDAVVAADEEEEMKTAVRALDRVLRARLFWVPQWYKDVHTVAYYDMFDHPDPLPPFALGQLDFWWHDAEGEARLRAAGVLR